MDWRKPKKIGEIASLQHGTMLFIEDNDPKADFNTFNWK